jgi:hypothetical protein
MSFGVLDEPAAGRIWRSSLRLELLVPFNKDEDKAVLVTSFADVWLCQVYIKKAHLGYAFYHIYLVCCLL